jgi:dipeptidyl aminopeptidase/acylaminoacyl peptidase
MSHDGHRVAYETMDGFGRHDLRTLDLRTDEERVVKVFDDPTEQFSLGEFHHIRFPSTDGISPYAYVFVPRDFDPRKKYPVLVDVHGGGSGSSLYLQAPLTIACSHGPLEWHLWASLGYVVIVPDYRSTGYYGPVPAATKQPRDVTGEDVRDAVSALRFMTSQSFVDPTRTALIGHSAGGARGYRLLTEHPDLFRAALLNEGASPDPLSTMLSLSTGGYTGREFEGVTSDVLGGRLSQIPETYKHNAIFNAYRVRTATLILLGNDALGGVGHLPHQVLYSILRAYGTPTRLLSFVDEGHTYTRRESARLAFREAQRWFEKHLSTEPMPARQASAD